MVLMTTITAWAEDDGAESVLKNYVERPEPAYGWSVVDAQAVEGVKVHHLLLTSQVWREIPWTHHLSVVVPEQRRETGYSLLFITGGGNENGKPRFKKGDDEDLQMIGQIAKYTGSPVGILRQVPNQPLYGGKVEDELIAHTYDQFLRSGDREWPLLLPMAKSAVKAMDAVQEFCKKEVGLDVDRFVVSGGSKRGWTTWLTGAVDKRVAAIAPIVIDTLNFHKQMPYQLEVWGKYSDQIEDYTRLGIQERMDTPQGRFLNKIVDPYAYVDSYTMPKFIFIGTNDPYWPVDALRHYWDDLPGEKFIHYVPNVGHGLGDGKQAVEALAAFFATEAAGLEHPSVDWSTAVSEGKVNLHVKSSCNSAGIQLWTAQSPDRDFRNDQFSSQPIAETGAMEGETAIDLPESGYKAFYAQVMLPHPIEGTYSKCTRMYVATPEGLVN